MLNINSNDNIREKDFEEIDVVKKYLSRIYTVLKKEIREELLGLKISEEEKKKFIQELAFLPIEKQKEFLEDLKLKYSHK